MIIVRAPFRVSFFGGGTDFPEFYREYGGCVLSTAIDKYCYITFRPLPGFFSYKNQFTYSKIERFNDASELQHPLVRAALDYVPTDRIQIAYDADLPAGTGIGSSSSFAVGLLQGLYAMHGEYPSKADLAREAVYLERKVLNEAGGEQDQYAAAYGGLNKISFSTNGVRVENVDISLRNRSVLESNLFLLFTGITRFSGEISSEQRSNISSRIAVLKEMMSMVDTGLDLIKSNDFDSFGLLLGEAYRLKKTLSTSISTSAAEEMYIRAEKAGATGGKIIGAGGGGFLLMYVPERNRERFLREMRDFEIIPFHMEDSGASIIYSG